MTAPLVLKLGGELIETAADRTRIADFARTVSAKRPLAIVHGGGRAIDAELARRHISPKKVDGLRVTDAATLEAVVAVLAGSANTDLVASFVAGGVKAVGLTGVDAGFGRAVQSGQHRTASGAIVDLGLVGDPARIDGALVSLLMSHGYVPVIASLGVSDAGVLNVNADVMACRIAGALDRSELVIAGTTSGVFDDAGKTIEHLDVVEIDAMIAGGTATAGMIAKLSACRAALEDGVTRVRIVDGRRLDANAVIDSLAGTTLRLQAPGSRLQFGNSYVH